MYVYRSEEYFYLCPYVYFCPSVSVSAHLRLEPLQLLLLLAECRERVLVLPFQGVVVRSQRRQVPALLQFLFQAGGEL